MPAPSPTHLIGKEFTMVREFSAPRELVWKACTQSEHLAQWWGPKGFTAPVCEWDAKPGNKIHVIMRSPDGQDFPMGGEFREVVAPEKLVTVTGALDASGKALFQFLHTLTLVERGGKTVLTMHSRIISVSPGADQYIGGFEIGMNMTLDRLVEHMASKSEPFVIERTYAAPAELVWKAITTRDDIKEWFFDFVGFKAEVGCEFHFIVEHEGHTYDHRCKVMEVIPGKRLAYSWRYAEHPGDSLVSLDLTAEDNQTRIRLTHIGLESFPALPQFARTNFEKGWTSLIGTELKQFVEKR